MKLVAATNNLHKLEEIRYFLEPLGVEVSGIVDLNISLPDDLEVFSTYSENAQAKCDYVSRFTTLPILADDSGLEIETLNAKPGIHSARYSETGLDHDNRKKVMLEMNSVSLEKRGAKFICVLCLLVCGRHFFFQGESFGSILTKEEGSNGFGYDSLFYCLINKKSYANLTRIEKLEVCHRGLALKLLQEWIKKDKIPKVGLEPTKGCPH